MEFGGERVTIRAGRTAHDLPLLAVAGVAGGRLPRLIVDHRTFHREDAQMVVGDDQVERRSVERR